MRHLYGDDTVHGNPGAGVRRGHHALDALRWSINHPTAKIHEVGHVVPKQIVGPASAIAGRSDILQTADEKPAAHLMDLLLSRLDAGPQRHHLRPEAQGMNHTEEDPA